MTKNVNSIKWRFSSITKQTRAYYPHPAPRIQLSKMTLAVHQFLTNLCKHHFKSNTTGLSQNLSSEIRAASRLPSPNPATRRDFTLFTSTTILSGLLALHNSSYSWSKPTTISDFIELPNSGGVKALDLRVGEGAENPANGDKVVIHYYGRLAAKQGWRFDSTYDHKDENGEPIPFEFVLGSGKVISGIDSAVKSMKVGGIRRVIIPPSQGYQNTSQEPIPPNFFDRQRLFTTIFNPTRMANGEGSTLGTVIFDIELVSLRHE